MMTIDEWLKRSTQQLKEAGINTARLDCLVLLEDASGKDRGWLLSHSEDKLQGSDLKKLNTKIAQRAKHIPLAYLRGHAEFYGRDFIVNTHTLVPRPETEAMIELLKVVRNLEADVATWQRERRGRKPLKKRYLFEDQKPSSELVKTETGYKVVWKKLKRPNQTNTPAPVHGQSLKYHDEDLYLIDVGTGSGAIAVTAKLELPDAYVIATDIDEKCLETVRSNAQKLGADISFARGNLLEAVPPISEDKVAILLCNLPYVPDNFQINTAATHEPRHALFGGPDGLDLYRELFQQIKANSWKPEYVLTESLPPQHETLATIANEHDYKLTRTDDFIQLFERVA